MTRLVLRLLEVVEEDEAVHTEDGTAGGGDTNAVVDTEQHVAAAGLGDHQECG